MMASVIAMETFLFDFSHRPEVFLFAGGVGEPTSFDINEQVLSEIKGPLTSANIALQYLLFFQKEDGTSG
jgi:hypothetical protein